MLSGDQSRHDTTDSKMRSRTLRCCASCLGGRHCTRDNSASALGSSWLVGNETHMQSEVLIEEENWIDTAKYMHTYASQAQVAREVWWAQPV